MFIFFVGGFIQRARQSTSSIVGSLLLSLLTSPPPLPKKTRKSSLRPAKTCFSVSLYKQQGARASKRANETMFRPRRLDQRVTVVGVDIDKDLWDAIDWHFLITHGLEPPFCMVHSACLATTRHFPACPLATHIRGYLRHKPAESQPLPAPPLLPVTILHPQMSTPIDTSPPQKLRFVYGDTDTLMFTVEGPTPRGLSDSEQTHIDFAAMMYLRDHRHRLALVERCKIDPKFAQFVFEFVHHS